MVEKQKG